MNVLRSRTGRIVIALLVVVAAAQFVPIKRTDPPVVSTVEAPDSVLAVLRRSCFDCHSNETRWPWYSHVAPVSWFVVRHVNRGRGDLNFSEWPAFDFELEAQNLHDIAEQVSEGKMPLRSYTLVHWGAKLDADASGLLLRWAKSGVPVE